MRATSVIRFALFGAVGFGIGWAIAGAFAITAPLWPYFVAGACGGLGLGLVHRSIKRVAVLALAGSLGFGIGFVVEVVVAVLLLGEYIGAAMGMFGGAAIGLTMGDLRKVVILAVAGLVGFGLGGAIALALQPIVLDDSVDWASSPPPVWKLALVEALRGIIGGASLGAALGYLESRMRDERPRPRVR